MRGKLLCHLVAIGIGSTVLPLNAEQRRGVDDGHTVPKGMCPDDTCFFWKKRQQFMQSALQKAQKRSVVKERFVNAVYKIVVDGIPKPYLSSWQNGEADFITFFFCGTVSAQPPIDDLRVSGAVKLRMKLVEEKRKIMVGNDNAVVAGILVHADDFRCGNMCSEIIFCGMNVQLILIHKHAFLSCEFDEEVLFEKSTSSNSTAKTFHEQKNTIFVRLPSLKFFEWGLGKIFFLKKFSP